MNRTGVYSFVLVLLLALSTAFLPVQGELEGAKDFPGTFQTIFDLFKGQILSAMAEEASSMSFSQSVAVGKVYVTSVNFAEATMTLTEASLKGGAVRVSVAVDGLKVIGYFDPSGSLVPNQNFNLPANFGYTLVVGVEYAPAQLPPFNLSSSTGALSLVVTVSGYNINIPLPGGDAIADYVLPDLGTFLAVFMSKLHVVEMELATPEGELTTDTFLELLENYTMISESRVVLGTFEFNDDSETGSSTFFTFWVLDGTESGTGSGNNKMLEVYKQFEEEDEPHLADYPVTYFNLQCCATCGDCKAEPEDGTVEDGEEPDGEEDGVEDSDSEEDSQDGVTDGDGSAASSLSMLFF
ncbi:hypothetical protein QOT17_002583 [Balamuthia mandrillaris]